jgi:hypothetical protein
MSMLQIWIAFAVILTLAILIFGGMPTWVRWIRSPRAGPPPVEFTVTIEGGQGGSVWYREGPHEHRFDWELAGNAPSVCFVYVPTYERWGAAVPWAPDRREEILHRVAAEVQRQKCRDCRWEMDEAAIHFYER